MKTSKTYRVDYWDEEAKTFQLWNYFDDQRVAEVVTKRIKTSSTDITRIIEITTTTSERVIDTSEKPVEGI